MSWTLSAWAVGTGRRGQEQAVKIQMKRPDYDEMEEIALVHKATEIYRREYESEDPEATGSSHEGSDGPGARPGI
jgi:hypothetical protein